MLQYSCFFYAKILHNIRFIFQKINGMYLIFISTSPSRNYYNSQNLVKILKKKTLEIAQFLRTVETLGWRKSTTSDDTR